MKSCIKTAKILIVDDVKRNHDAVNLILKSGGYNNIFNAKTGKEALDSIIKVKPDIILLDLLLPDISGLDICKGIKDTDGTKDIRIIVQGSGTNNCNKLKAIELGANDFVQKPVNEDELLVTMKAQLEQLNLYNGLKEANQRMEKELDEAEKMLGELIPSQDHLDKLGKELDVNISAYYKPCSELGGDFYDVVDLGKRKVGLSMWDFAGHGVGAAINTFRLHGILKENREYNNNPGNFVSKVNSILYNMLPRSKFATMFYGVLDLNKKVLKYSCASCPPPILISFKNKKFKTIDAKEFPLGIQNKSEYKTNEVSIKDWDALILYSDALTESEDKNGKFIPIEEMTEHVIKQSKGKNISSDEIRDIIMRKFNSECIDNLGDDLTLKVVSFHN
jgi:sigma-B regulation protein RsbU (phosphoserine phosphatase)